MRSRFRSALMWLLLLALPLQGFAAVTMLNCGPNHQRMWEAALAEPAGSHDHATRGHHQHEMSTAGNHHDTASADAETDPSSVHQLNKLTKFKCSACAACCIGVALPTAALAFASMPPAEALRFFVPAPHVDFVTDGLDRPPRLLLA